ncbi:MAG: molybdopterin dinucleotide binding domain-containing protein, partial [Pseudomonadota bacterium]
PSLASREQNPLLWISPAEASTRGITDGASIQVSNTRGSFDAIAKVTPRMPDGAVWIRDGWPGYNALTGSRTVLPDAALDAFYFSVGQSAYQALVEVAPSV